jgi:chromosome segregation ATPase
MFSTAYSISVVVDEELSRQLYETQQQLKQHKKLVQELQDKLKQQRQNLQQGQQDYKQYDRELSENQKIIQQQAIELQHRQDLIDTYQSELNSLKQAQSSVDVEYFEQQIRERDLLLDEQRHNIQHLEEDNRQQQATIDQLRKRQSSSPTKSPSSYDSSLKERLESQNRKLKSELEHLRNQADHNLAALREAEEKVRFLEDSKPRDNDYHFPESLAAQYRQQIETLETVRHGLLLATFSVLIILYNSFTLGVAKDKSSVL